MQKKRINNLLLFSLLTVTVCNNVKTSELRIKKSSSDPHLYKHCNYLNVNELRSYVASLEERSTDLECLLDNMHLRLEKYRKAFEVFKATLENPLNLETECNNAKDELEVARSHQDRSQGTCDYSQQQTTETKDKLHGLQSKQFKSHGLGK